MSAVGFKLPLVIAVAAATSTGRERSCWEKGEGGVRIEIVNGNKNEGKRKRSCG